MKVNPKIFISHASKDKYITDAFIELILLIGLGINRKDVYCTSYIGTKIETGLDWRNSIKEAISQAKVVFLFISPHYKESEMCQNEMGAAWVLNTNTIPFIIPPIKFSTVGPLTAVKQISELFDEHALDEIKDILVRDLPLDHGSISSALWSQKKSEFVIKCTGYLDKEENKYPEPLTRDTLDKSIYENKTLRSTIESQIIEKEKLEEKIEKLKRVKDAKEVKKVEQELSDDSLFNQFEEMTSKIAQLLNKNTGIVNGIIFNDFLRKGLNVEVQNYRNEIDNAVAAKIIEVDEDDFNVNWENREMKELRKKLEEIQRFMSQVEDEDFYERFEQEYKIDFEFDNIVFWKKVFSTSVFTN